MLCTFVPKKRDIPNGFLPRQLNSLLLQEVASHGTWLGFALSPLFPKDFFFPPRT